MWQLVALWVVSMALTYLLAPKPADAEEPKFGELEVPTADQSRSIPVIFGTVWIKDPNVVWYGDLKTKKIKSSEGKK